MEPGLLAAFLFAAVLLALAPGPDVVLLLSQLSVRGLRAAMGCALGIFLSGLMLSSLVATGLGEALARAPELARVVRLVGAAYLALLGVAYLRAWWRREWGKSAPSRLDHSESSYASPVIAGLLNNLLNPKALLFFGLFLPQFVTPSGWDMTLQIWLLGCALSSIALAINVSLVWLAFRTSMRLTRGRRWLAHRDGLAGALFIWLAFRLSRGPAST